MLVAPVSITDPSRAACLVKQIAKAAAHLLEQESHTEAHSARRTAKLESAAWLKQRAAALRKPPPPC